METLKKEVQQKEISTYARQLSNYQTELSGKQARAEQLTLRIEKVEHELQEVGELKSLEEEQAVEARIQWQSLLKSKISNGSTSAVFHGCFLIMLRAVVGQNRRFAKTHRILKRCACARGSLLI